MGGSKEPDITQVPLMNPQQTQFLGQLLNFIPQAMGGFELGQAYGGPSEASYSPFTIPGGGGGAMPSGKGGGGGMSEGSTRRGPHGETITDVIQAPMGVLEEQPGEREGEKVSTNISGYEETRAGETEPYTYGGKDLERKAYGIEAEPMDLEPVLDAILGPSLTQFNLPKVSPESLEMQPISPIQQALTQPIVSSFTQGMTGNYPKRPRVGARGGRR